MDLAQEVPALARPLAPSRLALSRLVSSRLAPSRLGLSRLALSQLAPSRLAPSQLAPSRLVASARILALLRAVPTTRAALGGPLAAVAPSGCRGMKAALAEVQGAARAAARSTRHAWDRSRTCSLAARQAGIVLRCQGRDVKTPYSGARPPCEDSTQSVWRTLRASRDARTREQKAR